MLVGCGTVPKVAHVAFAGDHIELNKRGETDPIHSPKKPPILYLALDGVGRDTLYPLLREGKMPNLARLLSGDGTKFRHAHFSEKMLSTLPSSTMAAWMTTMTGVAPAVHGITGNEYFIRESLEMACPAPVSFVSAEPTLEIYTDGYLDKLSASPSVYQQMRERDPFMLAWVALHGVYRGADQLLLGRKGALANALRGYIEVQVEKHLENTDSRKLYAELDDSLLERVALDIDKQAVLPDFLTIYIAGADLYAHVAEEGPDKARDGYLTEVLDPKLGQVVRALERRHGLDGRWVVVGADHGHTQVVHDEAHALSTKKDEDPPAVLERSGFRVRPFERKVARDAPFDAALAYGGAMAYVYLADRSTCTDKKQPCDWNKPPRYTEDVLAAAEAFRKNNEDGALVPQVKGALDLILVRKPKPYAEIDLPFEVYVGDGKSVPISTYLQAHPHPTYVAVESRLQDLAVGRHGERAGDILLLAHNGDRDVPAERFYFAAPYHSWHGSPSKLDSEIPFIVANSNETSSAIGAVVDGVLGDRPYQQKTTDVFMRLRFGAPALRD